MLMINIIFIIVFFTKNYMIKRNEYIKYYKLQSNIKLQLLLDVNIYARCIKKTGIITCGRNKSNVQKKKKIVKKNKQILFTKYYHTISKSIKKCSNRIKKYIIAIDTGPDYFSERLIYREYYSKYINVQLYFFSGLSSNTTINDLIKCESNIYKDIVLFPFISTYYTSSITVISELKWIKARCRSFKWIIHHQADVYINISKTFITLKEIKCTKCCFGRKIINMPVARSKNNVWYMPYNIYSKNRWPTYFSGAIIYFTYQSFLILTDLIGKVHPQIWIDDIYIGLLLQKSDIKLNNIKFNYIPDIPLKSIESFQAVHGFYPSELYYLIMR